ncbi:MAG TPA: glycosyltransferase, partial [Chitinophagaceae bacterium]|nr:glycosyltransferase [Chitinophagaceae bacterium]
QRMNRICTSLSANGYTVTLVGRKLPGSIPLKKENYNQKRLGCWFKKGKWFYAEFNIRLFFYLLFQKMDAICSIDLDTILPCLRLSNLKNIPRVYDAHELFTELKEVVTRPVIKKIWSAVERSAVPNFSLGYTVSESIAEEFHRRYGSNFQTIRNVPWLRPLDQGKPPDRFILYLGAVNEARAFEFLVPAMKQVACNLVICGDGNFMNQLKKLISDHQLQHKIELRGMLPPEQLWIVAQQAYIGVAVAEKEGLNQYFALPNKFFDYIHAGLPQVTMNYPEYKKINQQFEVALLIDELAPETIAHALNKLLADDVIYNRLKESCLVAREELNWQKEEKKLLAFYQSVFNK